MKVEKYLLQASSIACESSSDLPDAASALEQKKHDRILNHSILCRIHFPLRSCQNALARKSFYGALNNNGNKWSETMEQDKSLGDTTSL